MHSRGIWFEGTDHQLPEATAAFTGEVAPRMRQRSGYLAAALIHDAEAARSIVVTYYSDAAAIAASREAAEQTSSAVAQRFGYRVADIAEYEMLFREVAEPARAGDVSRVIRTRLDVGRLEELREFLVEQVAPVWRSAPGFRSGTVWVNRETGEALVNSNWDNRETLQASYRVLDPMRGELAARLGHQVQPAATYEILATDVAASLPSS